MTLPKLLVKTNKSHNLLFWAMVISTTIYIVWRLLFTIPTRSGPMTFVLGLLLVAAELVGAVESLIEHRQINQSLVPELPEIPPEWYPDVDIFVATHNEDVELLYKTVNACTFLQYPDRNKVHVYLCDDNDRPEMAELAQNLGIGYFGLSDNKQAKAGNLNNAMRKTNSPLIVTMDSDMIPHSDFLIRTVPYFFLPKVKKDEQGVWVERTEEEVDPDYKIGFIQTPQSFYNPDLFQYYLYSEQRIPNEQDYFFREVNVGRNVDNAVIYAGSNTVLSRKALEEVGYIATTSITEDFLTGLRIQKKGYTTYATPEALAHGLAPDSFKSLITQRERWGRGCVQSLKQEHIFLSPKLRPFQKISYLATLLYWWTYARRLIYIFAPILSIIFNLYIVDAKMWQVLVFWLPYYLLYNRTLRLLSGDIRNQHWSNVCDTILFPYLLGPILFETLGIKKRDFVVTEKKKVNPSKKMILRSAIVFSLPHLMMLCASLWALILLIINSVNTRTIYNPIILYWLIINIKNLIFAVFFMYGRTNQRMNERFYVKIPVVICTEKHEFAGETADVSETGLAILLDSPVYLSGDIPLRIIVSSEKYQAELSACLSSVTQAGQNWKYSFRIDSMDDENRRQYMQIVYDRAHTLPKKLDPSLSVFDDFNLNLIKRSKHYQASKRKLPRITLHLPFETDQGVHGQLIDFNYEFAKLSTNIRLEPGERLTISYGSDAVLVLGPMNVQTDNSQANLYRVVDYYRVVNQDEFIENPDYDKTLNTWLKLQSYPANERPVGSATISVEKSKEEEVEV